MPIIFTVGHSTHTQDHFIHLLRQHAVTALCDVRSRPYSRTNPQFNREDLNDALKAAGITYVFLGKELGARSEDPACYVNGQVQYDRLAQTELFKKGLERVCAGVGKYSLSLMCAEKEPLDCHRTILVARHLAARDFDIRHIHGDGHLESHGDLVERLLRQLRMPEIDMFRSRADVLADAYHLQEQRIAYSPGMAKPFHLERAGNAAG
jgi:uncharacterized protein (DUF488 family)